MSSAAMLADMFYENRKILVVINEVYLGSIDNKKRSCRVMIEKLRIGIDHFLQIGPVDQMLVSEITFSDSLH